MSANTLPEDKLQAYVDGVLEAGEAEQVEAYLAENPDEAARLHGYRLQNAMLQDLGGLLEQAPPPHTPVWQSAPGWRRHLLQAAVVLLAVLAGAAGGWLVRDLTGGPGTVAAPGWIDQAAIAHRVYVPEVRHPVEVPAEQEQHLVTWLSKRLGAPLRAPHLQPYGYGLVGGRLLPAAQGPAAQFMYQNESGMRLTLYVVTDLPGNRETAFRFRDRDGLSLFYWVDRELAYAMAAPLPKDELLTMARAVYMQVEGFED